MRKFLTLTIVANALLWSLSPFPVTFEAEGTGSTGVVLACTENAEHPFMSQERLPCPTEACFVVDDLPEPEDMALASTELRFRGGAPATFLSFALHPTLPFSLAGAPLREGLPIPLENISTVVLRV